jgi:cytochrome c heme-lyase
MGNDNLRNERIISSIPRDLEIGSEKCQCPHILNKRQDQDQNKNSCPLNDNGSNNLNWVYPSPKMFWEAMNKKGTLPPHLKDPSSEATKEEIDWIVTIHNVVNEQCWQEVCKWEKFRLEGCKGAGILRVSDLDIKLQRFLGRPDDMSPRAWFKSNILGCKKPFDRHDWYVKSSSNSAEPPRRYVIDFYSGKGEQKEAASFYLDVRPALDSTESFLMRIRKFICDKLK